MDFRRGFAFLLLPVLVLVLRTVPLKRNETVLVLVFECRLVEDDHDFEYE